MTMHDATRGDLCACRRCDLERVASLASSRAMSAEQAAAWRPRSRKLAAAARAAVAARDDALHALHELQKRGRRPSVSLDGGMVATVVTASTGPVSDETGMTPTDQVGAVATHQPSLHREPRAIENR